MKRRTIDRQEKKRKQSTDFRKTACCPSAAVTSTGVKKSLKLYSSKSIVAGGETTRRKAESTDQRN